MASVTLTAERQSIQGTLAWVKRSLDGMSSAEARVHGPRLVTYRNQLEAALAQQDQGSGVGGALKRRDEEWRAALSKHVLAEGTPEELAALRKPDKVQVALFGRLEDVSEALAATPPPALSGDGATVAVTWDDHRKLTALQLELPEAVFEDAVKPLRFRIGRALSEQGEAGK